MNTLTPAELHQLLATVRLIDVREPEEVAASGVYQGAENIPMGKMFTEAGKGNLSKEQPIVVYCASGKRAGIVADNLAEAGYDIKSVTVGYADLKD